MSDFDINRAYGDTVADAEKLLKSPYLSEGQKRAVRVRLSILEEARRRKNAGEDPAEVAAWLKKAASAIQVLNPISEKGPSAVPE